MVVVVDRNVQRLWSDLVNGRAAGFNGDVQSLLLKVLILGG